MVHRVIDLTRPEDLDGKLLCSVFISPLTSPLPLLSVSSGLARFREFYLLLVSCIHHFGSLERNLDAQKQEGTWKTTGENK